MKLRAWVVRVCGGQWFSASATFFFHSFVLCMSAPTVLSSFCRRDVAFFRCGVISRQGRFGLKISTFQIMTSQNQNTRFLFYFSVSFRYPDSTKKFPILQEQGKCCRRVKMILIVEAQSFEFRLLAGRFRGLRRQCRHSKWKTGNSNIWLVRRTKPKGYLRTVRRMSEMLSLMLSDVQTMLLYLTLRIKSDQSKRLSM